MKKTSKQHSREREMAAKELMEAEHFILLTSDGQSGSTAIQGDVVFCLSNAMVSNPIVEQAVITALHTLIELHRQASGASSHEVPIPPDPTLN